MPMYAIEYYNQATSLRPYDCRMWTALATVYEGLQRSALINLVGTPADFAGYLTRSKPIPGHCSAPTSSKLHKYYKSWHRITKL